MALNYTFECTSVTANVNSTWGSVDVDGDGTIDAASLPLKITLTPTNTATHVISHNDFTIGGQASSSGGEPTSQDTMEGLVIEAWSNETETVSSSFSSSLWDGQQVSLPEGVRKVVGVDTAEPGTVGNQACFYVYLETLFQIGSSNIEITLDLDGDAQPIPTTETEVGSFYIKCRMQNPNTQGNAGIADPNCIIIPNVNDHINNQENHYNAKPIKPPNELASFVSTGGVGAIGYAPYTLQDGTVLTTTSSSVTDFENLNILFYILPKPGYRLSRHMLTIDLSTTTSSDYSLEMDGNSYNNTTNPNISPSITSDNTITPALGLKNKSIKPNYIKSIAQLYNVPMEIIDEFVGQFPFGIAGFGLKNDGTPTPVSHPYYYNNYNNVVASTNIGDLTTTIQWGNEIPPSNSNNFNLGILGDILLIDTVLNEEYTSGDIWPQVEPGYNFPWSASNSFLSGNDLDTPDIPEGYCPNNFKRNCVAVCVNNFNQYVPSSDFTGNENSGINITIKGGAVLNDPTCESVSFNINIEEG